MNLSYTMPQLPDDTDEPKKFNRLLKMKKEHSFVYSMMRIHSHRWQAITFRTIILTLIVLDVIAFVLETVHRFHDDYHFYFEILEAVSSIVFLIEYILRVMTIPESKQNENKSPYVSRWEWILSLESLIDLLCFTPWFVEVIFAVNLPNLSPLRAIRLFKLIKAQSVGHSFDVLARVVYYNSDILATALIICVVLMLLLSSLLYYFRPPADFGFEEDFSSIPRTMYVSIMMLTGQGGPEGALPWYTKGIVLVCAVFAVGLFAIFASMLTWGFEQEAERLMIKRHDRQQRVLQQKAQILISGQSYENVDFDLSSESSEDEFHEWKEYEDVVVGSDSDSERSEEVQSNILTPEELSRASRLFSMLDTTEDLKITTDELAMITPSEEQSEDLMNAIDPDNDGYTTAEDFIAWLNSVKTRQRKVFGFLLKQMEDAAKRNQKRGQREQRRSRSASTSSTLRPTKEIGARDSESEAGQLFSGAASSLAETLRALQQEAEQLRERNRQLEESIDKLKSDT